MGTTTFYLKHNDLGPSFNALTKDDCEALNKLFKKMIRKKKNGTR